MKIIDIEQNSEVWADWRRDKIGGSDSKAIKPLTRGELKGLPESSAGFWQFVANTVAVEKDGEDERDRGHRLEEENLARTNKKLNLKMQKCGVWVSDYSEFIHISPDGSDSGKRPKNAFEAKAFDTHKHLQIIYFDRLARKENEYNPLLSLPKDNQDQAIKYFAINDDLKYLHWALINDFVALPEFEHYIITIERTHVADLVETQKEIELAAIKKRDEIIKFLRKELK